MRRSPLVSGLAFALILLAGCTFIGALVGWGIANASSGPAGALGPEFDRQVSSAAGGVIGLLIGSGLAAILVIWRAGASRKP